METVGGMFALGLLGHLIGDYILQNDHMATDKKKSSAVCAFHCLIWTTCVGTITGISGQWIIFWLFATHFAIDRWSFIPYFMDHWSGQAVFREKLGPWSAIVVDNIWHLVTIYIAVRWELWT